MPPELKDQIQNAGLTLLVDNDYSIQKSAANLVSTIYILRFQLSNKWEDLLSKLSDNASSKKPEIQKASIYTISYICEELFSKKLLLSDNEIEKILSSICSSISEDQPNEDVKLTGLKAFQVSHNYFSNIMQQEKIRTFVMDLLVKCTIRPNNSPDITMLAYECLTDISTVLYDHLGSYLPVISKLSIDLINSPTENEMCIIPAMEFWTSIA